MAADEEAGSTVDASAADSAVGGENAPQECAVEDGGSVEGNLEVKDDSPRELEGDAPADSREKLTTPIEFKVEDTTLNVMQTPGSKLLTALTDVGLEYLLAGARAEVGLRAGRYMFEVAILQILDTSEQPPARPKQAKKSFRVGFAPAGSSLFLPGDGVCFDSEGSFHDGKTVTKAAKPFQSGEVAAVVLNLDGGPNGHTVSLFVDGARASPPQPLPERLRGLALFPAVSYRGMLARVNLGKAALRPLPFACRTLQEAAVEDCEVRSAQRDRPEVLLPVALPDEGGFDWVDGFLAKRPEFLELSSRAICDWAQRSDLWRTGQRKKGSNDRPEVSYGVPEIDEGRTRAFLDGMAPLLRRSYVVAEVEGNLLADSRRQVCSRFPSAQFKRTAVVLMGEPPVEFKQQVQAKMLAEKRTEAEARRKLLEAKRKMVEAKAPQAKKAKKEEAGGSVDSAKAAAGEAEGGGKAEGGKGEHEGNEKEIEVELTDAEKARWFRRTSLPDVLPQALCKSFTEFTLPAEDEGFDEIRFEWQPQEKCKEYLEAWMAHKKKTERVEEVQPSTWFSEKLAAWKKAEQEWKKKHSEWKKIVDQIRQWQKESSPDGASAASKPGGREEKLTDIDAEDVDVFTVENVSDIGTGEPLFANFQYEDWCLLSLRFELHLLCLSYRHDLDDPERPTFHSSHLPFYYSRYYKKPLDTKLFSTQDVPELVKKHLEDTVKIDLDTSMLQPLLPESTPLDRFVRLVEDSRRDRKSRLDAGDETAELRFRKQPAGPPPKYITRRRDELKAEAAAIAEGGSSRRAPDGPWRSEAPPRSSSTSSSSFADRQQGWGGAASWKTATRDHHGGGGGDAGAWADRAPQRRGASYEPRRGSGEARGAAVARAPGRGFDAYPRLNAGKGPPRGAAAAPWSDAEGRQSRYAPAERAAVGQPSWQRHGGAPYERW